MQQYLKIIVASTNHVKVTTEVQGAQKDSTSSILTFNVASGVGPVPLCVAFCFCEVSPTIKDKLHDSVRQVLNIKFQLNCDFEYTAEFQYVLAESVKSPDQGQQSGNYSEMPAFSVFEWVIPESNLPMAAQKASEEPIASQEEEAAVKVNVQAEPAQTDHLSVMEVGGEQESQEVDDPFVQVKVEAEEVKGDVEFSVNAGQDLVEAKTSLAQVDINKMRSNLNYLADLVDAFQSDPTVISAVSVFNENVDTIETPQQLAAFFNNFVQRL